MLKLIVEKVINEWDPIGLLYFCPPDEYESEIDSIVKIVERTTNIEEIANGISLVFVNSFGEDVFKQDKNECKSIAEIIIEKMTLERKL